LRRQVFRIRFLADNKEMDADLSEVRFRFPGGAHTAQDAAYSAIVPAAVAASAEASEDAALTSAVDSAGTHTKAARAVARTG
jgi:hypothetical protein